jgi:hypothetical protein
VLGDLDCDEAFTGADVLVQTSLAVAVIEWIDLPMCVSGWDDVLAASDWDCNGAIDGVDALVGAAINVDMITQEDTSLGQGCP